MGRTFENNVKNNERFSDITGAVTISFTGNAINYLPFTIMPINLEEWVWHEGVVNGRKCCIVTDKIMSTGMSDSKFHE
ncbi:MAG: hypothetical protein QM594_14795 [Niabella sp.]